MLTLRRFFDPALLILLLFGIVGCDQKAPVTESSTATPAPVVSAPPSPTFSFPSAQLFDVWVASAQKCYSEAQLTYLEFDAKAQEFLGTPSQLRLRQLQDAWSTAHHHYAACRIFQQPIASDRQTLLIMRNQLDAWPIMGGFLDAVPQYPDTGLINHGTIEMSIGTLIDQHQLTDPTEVTLGFHALEFLLWGEDLSRSFTDYLPFAPEPSEAGFDSNRENRRRQAFSDILALVLNQTGQLQARWLESGSVWRTEVGILPEVGQAQFLLASYSGFLQDFRSRYFNLNSSGDLFLLEENPFSHTTRDDLLASLHRFQTMKTALVQVMEDAGIAETEAIAALERSVEAIVSITDKLPRLSSDTAQDWFAVAPAINDHANKGIQALSDITTSIGLP